MFELLLKPGKRRKAQAVLANRINERAMQELTSDRAPERSPFCKTVYLIPPRGRSWDPANASIVVSRDIAPGGLSIVHTSDLNDTEVLIGLPSENATRFLRCAVQHSTDIGHGYFQIGLMAEQVDDLDRHENEALEQRVAELIAGRTETVS